jgi:hypothetical protein
MSIETGAMARTTQDFHEDGYSYSKGTEFEVEEYATAEEADATHGYYMGNNSGGFNNVEVREDHAELIKSRAEMRKRTIPTLAEVAEHIASESLGGWDGIEIDEADYSAKDGTFEVYGKSADGLRFTAVVQVLQVEHADF